MKPSEGAKIRAEHLVVCYGRNTALDDLTLEIPRGIVGLLGPNGAGKSTFMKTLLGLVEPNGGLRDAIVLGANTVYKVQRDQAENILFSRMEMELAYEKRIREFSSTIKDILSTATGDMERSVKSSLNPVKELEKQVGKLQEQISEITHKATSKGKTKEIELARRIQEISPEDIVDHVGGSGKPDIVIRVFKDAREKATIVIESKNVEKWSPKYVDEAIRHMDRHNTEYCILATTMMPPACPNDKFECFIGKVWVVKEDCLEFAYLAMRTFAVRAAELKEQYEAECEAIAERLDFDKEAAERLRNLSGASEFQSIGSAVVEVKRMVKDDQLLWDRASDYILRTSKKGSEIGGKITNAVERIIVSTDAIRMELEQIGRVEA